MDFTVDWVLPVGLGILGTLFTLFKWNVKTIPVKSRNSQTRR